MQECAKKSGFKDFAEYDEVAANILMIFAGINPQTRRYTDPQTAMKQKIAEITADKTLAATDKKELLNEFEKRLNALPCCNCSQPLLAHLRH